jgi:hypothetical protein
MLKGSTPLLQKLPPLIEATSDAALRWRYTSMILLDPPLNALVQDPDRVIEEGVQYYEEGTRPIGEGIVICTAVFTYRTLIAGNTAVDFYNVVARHYNSPEYRNLIKATEFNKRAFSLAQRAEDIHNQLQSLDAECWIAITCGDPYWVLRVVRKAQDIAGFLSPAWVYHEAWANYSIGNLSRALSLCTRVEEQLTAFGMEDSLLYLNSLMAHGNALRRKTEYLEAHQIFTQIVGRTSLTRSPDVHAHALFASAAIDFLMQGDTANIASTLDAAKTAYMVCGSPRILLCSMLEAVLNLPFGDVETARATILECLSKSRGVYSDIPPLCLLFMSDPVHKMHGAMDTFRWAVVCFAWMQKAKDAYGTVQALRRFADIYMIMGDEETALHLFHTTLDAGTKLDIHHVRAECMVGIGDIMLRRGDNVQAKKMWAAAHPLFLRSSRPKDAQFIKEQLEQLTIQENDQHPTPSKGV